MNHNGLLGRLRPALFGMFSLLAWSSAYAQATDLIISEYVEGTSNTRYLELFNGTSASINLSGYQLRLYNDGSTTPVPAALSGTLAAGATKVYRNSGAGTTGLPAAAAPTNLNTICVFTGNDAIALWKISTSSFVDVIGHIGCNPGASVGWVDLPNKTMDKTLRRKPSVCAGVTSPPIGAPCGPSFPTLLSEWDAFAMDDLSGLGSHTMICAPTVQFTTPNLSVYESAGTQTFELGLSSAPTAGSITIQITDGPGAVYGTDYTTTPAAVGGFITVNFVAGASTASFLVDVIDDALPESTETVTFTINSVPSGYVVGPENVRTLTILDDDGTGTILTPGDILVVGVNSNNTSCSGVAAEDLVSFFCFKPITTGTIIDLTDNGYGCNAGKWSESEGVVRMKRTGPTLPAGQVITFRIPYVSGSGNVVGAAPDAGWTCTTLSGIMNLNDDGDQLFFMQGGTWTDPAGLNNATYDGRILYAVNTHPSVPLWVGVCNDSKRSKLPPDMDCFSISLPSSGYSKYKGLVSDTTQYRWYHRVNTPANWQTHASCTSYNSAAPNWMTNIVLPILPGGAVAGLWMGTTSQDWNLCKNWDDLRIPTISTDVRITPAAVKDCWIGFSGSYAAKCRSLEVSSNASYTRNLTISNGSLTVNGPVLVENTGTSTWPANIAVSLGQSMSATDLTLRGTVTDGAWVTNLGTVNLERHLLLDLGGRMTPGTLNIGGNFTNTALDATRFQESGSTVTLNGASDQTIQTSGFEAVFYNLRVMKLGGDAVVASPVAMRNVLTLTNGRMMVQSPAVLTIRNGASIVNASDASFVHGPLRKIGDAPFIFPVGKGHYMRPCRLTDLASVTTSETWTAEYFEASSYLWGTPAEPTIHHTSDCEYWTIDHNVGSGKANVWLTWHDATSCGVITPSDLRVARWDAAGSIWRDRGNGNMTVTPWGGWVRTSAPQTLFSPWTLASTTVSNPLPIALLSFTAQPQGDVVRVDWATATEKDNAWFTVERSRDGRMFDEVLRVPGAGNSEHTLYYTDLDRTPWRGLSYYRLRQIDLDGTSTTSAIVPVTMGGAGMLRVFGTVDHLTAMHDFPAGSRYEVLDMTGRTLLNGSSTQDDLTEFPVNDLPRGAYVLRMSDGARVESVRFMY